MSAAQLAGVLGPLFPSLDGPLVEYLASVAVEAKAAKWTKPSEPFDAIGELLESYEAVADEKEAKAKCAELLHRLQAAGIAKAPAAAVAPSPAPIAANAKPSAPAPTTTTTAKTSTSTAMSIATKPVATTVATPSVAPQPGYTCQARYSGDGLFYPAMVLSVKTIPITRVRVRYTQFGDEEDLPLTALKDVVPGELPPPKPVGKRAQRETSDADQDDDEDDDTDDDDEDEADAPAGLPTKLRSAFTIGDLGPSAAALRIEERSLAQAEAEKYLTPKQLKLLRKRQAKAAKAAADLEAARTWNPQSHRTKQLDALPIYLQSRHLIKKAGTKDIALEDLSLLAPDNTELLANTELRLTHARRYGLIGRNGIGKSTLLRAISSYSLPKFPTYIKIMHVEQESEASTSSVLEVVMNADLERSMLLKEEVEVNARIKAAEASATLADAADSDRLTQIYERLLELDSHTAQARASTILNGLQFTQEMQAMPTKALSGGWRMRVALACALFVSPDLLLLDEPTNHLDYPAVLWLQSYLQSYPNTVLIVSHDRVFLNEVITDTIYFTNKKRLEYFRGDYNDFVKIKAERYKQEKRAYEAQQMQRQHIQDFITTFYTEKKSAAQDRKVGQMLSKQKQLDKMVLLENPDEESKDSFSLRFPEPGPLRVPTIAEIKHLYFRYPKRDLAALATASPSPEEEKRAEEERRLKRQQGTLGLKAAPVSVANEADASSPYLLEDINVHVEITSRIGIIGANGCGKSTLIKVLLGELQPVEGLVNLNPNVSIAYFTQHHVDQLNLGLTAVQWLQTLFPGTKEVECRRHLGRFGLIGDLCLMQMGYLSGGQKTRVAFSIICWRDPHLLIMDEPTNHLDMETIDVLITAVKEFKGCVIIISHDQHFLQGCMKEFWSIKDHKLRTFDNLDACKRATYSQLQ